MPRRLRRLAAVISTLALVAATALPAAAYEDHPAKNDTVSAGVDALFLRPLGFVALATGTVFFVAASPIVLITRPHEIHKPFNDLVVRPAKYVWVDPLGEH